MQGFYKVDTDWDEMATPTLTSHLVFGAGINCWQVGGKWRIQSAVEQYELAKMNQPAVGGPLGARRGARTTGWLDASQLPQYSTTFTGSRSATTLPTPTQRRGKRM